MPLKEDIEEARGKVIVLESEIDKLKTFVEDIDRGSGVSNAGIKHYIFEV